MGLKTNRTQKQGRKDINGMANRMYETCEINISQMNARQAFLKVKGGTPNYEVPKIDKCETKCARTHKLLLRWEFYQHPNEQLQHGGSRGLVAQQKNQ